VMLVSFWLLFMPAHRYASLDVKHGRVEKSLSCPNWCFLYFKIQFAIVYFFAATAKIYPDWLAAKPVKIWLSYKTHYPVVGGLFEYDWFPYVITYGGIAFDALVIPMLLFRKTRMLAVILSLVFHVFNSAVFQIGIFPYFALAVAVFFFEPETIRKRFFPKKPAFISSLKSIVENKAIPIIFLVYFIIQIALPLRHHFIPGNVLWDEAGHRLSWRMMLRSKAGNCTFNVEKKDGSKIKVYSQNFMARHQIRDVSTRPDMLYRAMDYLKEFLVEEGIEAKGIYCDCRVGVNGRRMTTFVDPKFNMLNAEWNYFGQQEWIAEEPDMGWESVKEKKK